MPDSGYGRHPVDQLIRELVRTARPVATGEVEQIAERIATARFDPRTVAVPPEERALSYQGRTLFARDEALFVHLVPRVLLDEQWAMGTTADEYVADLRRAARAADARLVVYARRGGLLAATLTPTRQAVDEDRRGLEWLPELLVVYSADRGIIVTGYQVSERRKASIPGDARWLT